MRKLCSDDILPRLPAIINFKTLNYLYFLPFLCYNESIPTVEGQTMNRNNGRKIAVRLFALRDYLYANADTEFADTIDEIMEYCQSR